MGFRNVIKDRAFLLQHVREMPRVPKLADREGGGVVPLWNLSGHELAICPCLWQIRHLKEGHFLVVQLLYVNLKPWDAKVHRLRKARPNSRSTVTQMRAQFFTPSLPEFENMVSLASCFQKGRRKSSLTCFNSSQVEGPGQKTRPQANKGGEDSIKVFLKSEEP